MKYVRVVFGILVSVLFLWFAFRSANLTKVWSIIKQANLYLLFASYLVAFFSLIVRSYRWKLLGKDYSNHKWESFFRATNMGLMLNVFLPFRAGDLFQSYFISQKTKLPKSYTLATVLLERFMDSIPPMLTLLVCSLFFVLPAQLNIKHMAVIVFGLLGVLVLFAVYAEEITEFVLQFNILNKFEKLKKFIENIAKVLGFIKDKQVLLKAVPITFINFIIIGTFSTMLVMLSLGINIGFFKTLFALSIMIVAFAIPSSPGFVGTFEFFCIFALGLFGIDKDTALSYALVAHFMIFLPVLTIGSIYFFKEITSGHFSFKGALQKDDVAE